MMVKIASEQVTYVDTHGDKARKMTLFEANYGSFVRGDLAFLRSSRFFEGIGTGSFGALVTQISRRRVGRHGVFSLCSTC